MDKNNELQLAAELAVDEGNYTHPYKDTKGIWTIGIGRNLESVGLSQAEINTILKPINPHQVYSKQQVIDLLITRGLTQDEIQYLFHNDVDQHETALVKAEPWVANLDPVRLGTMVNLAFNMGIATLLEFKPTLALIKSGNYTEAGNHLRTSKWYADVKFGRGEQIIKQLITGQWQPK